MRSVSVLRDLSRVLERGTVGETGREILRRVGRAGHERQEDFV